MTQTENSGAAQLGASGNSAALQGASGSSAAVNGASALQEASALQGASAPQEASAPQVTSAPQEASAPQVAPGNINLQGKSLLRLLDLTPAEFFAILNTALDQKKQIKNGILQRSLENEAVAIILEKPSLRTRASFEVGIVQLGGHPVVMADGNSAFSRGESIQDTVCVLERYVKCIVMRTFEQTRLHQVSKCASVPVINALTDSFHPCQGLADALTILEHKGSLAGLTFAYVGDGSNNMANTYCELAAITGMHLRVATPITHVPNQDVLDACRAIATQTGSTFKFSEVAKDAVTGADVVVTDTWTSMGASAQDELSGIFEPYQVNERLMRHAAHDAIFMHCLPAHRGCEVTNEVIDSPASVVYDEAENRLHAQRALLSLVAGG